MQIEDIDKRFTNLQNLKNNKWIEVLIPDKKKPTMKRGPARAKKVTARSKIKDMITNARKRKNNQDLSVCDDEANGDRIVKSSPLVQQSSAKKRSSLRVSTLTGEAKKKLSSSPGLAILRVSQAIKYGDGMTPSKSILKTDGSRSEKRATKSVLFKDLEEDKENNVEDFISFSPFTPRRSSRISRVT